ncbi:MAG: hypothetical protein NTV11_03835 [Rhodocyclales bacterium]|nr:hypothetical protein [Rhodocyclales bacterium]
MTVAVRLLLVGATGAVGRAVLTLALADPRVAQVMAVTCRPLAAATKLTNVVVDFDSLPADAPWWKVDAVVCTLGTTRRAARSNEKFAAVDRDLPLRIARLARAAGALLEGVLASAPASRLIESEGLHEPSSSGNR